MAMQEPSKYLGGQQQQEPLYYSLAANYYNPPPSDVNFPEYGLRQPSLDNYPTMPTAQQYQPPPSGFNIPDAAKGAGNIAGSFVLQESQARANLSQMEYQQELNRLKQEKYWWNPNYDVHPELEEYVGDMPSARDKLIDSTLTGGAMGGGAAEYAHHKGGQRALQGAAAASVVPGIGTAVGAVVGGLVGLVEGFFTWGQAAEKDKELRRKQRKKYERDLRKWKAQREKLISDYNQRVASVQIQGALSRAGRLKAERAQEEQDNTLEKYKKQARMINSIRSAVQAQQQRRNRLQSLSRHLQPLGA